MDYEKLDEESLKALLSDEIRQSITYDQTELRQKRVRAMEYYRGEMNDTPSLPGRSSVVSRDMADVVSWMLPGIIRVFTASDRMAICEPERPGDEQFAEQATDYINFVFNKDNDGYRVLWNATHDSLTQGNGIVKHWWDDKEECDYPEFSGMTVEQLALLQQERGLEIVSQEPGESQTAIMAGPDGQPVQQEIETFNVKAKHVKRNGRVRVKCIPPEDFLIDRDATCIEDARFTAHRDDVTKSDLIEMGFDRDVVDGLPDDYFSSLSEEKLAREDEYRDFNSVAHPSMRTIELFECYIRADADGDGIAETIRAYYAGNGGAGDLLDWEVWEDDVPFTDIPCEPVPHRWESRSIFDETEDLQRIKTVLTRQMLDNMYASNLPQREIEEGSVINPESLTSPKFGGVIIRKKGSQPVVPHVVPFVAEKVLVGLQHFDNVREMRTGVSRSTMALDPEALQNQTATASQNQKDSAYSQIELIARNQAELGWKRVFKNILRLVVQHQDRPRTIRLRDQWVDMDPRGWNAEMDVTINVGLGTGSRDRDMSMLAQIMQVQKAFIDQLVAAQMPDKAMMMFPKVVNAAKKLAEAAGVRNPDQFFPDITEENMQQIMQQKAQEPPQEDPKVAIEKQKLQAEMERGQAQMQMDAQKLQMESQMKQQQAQADAMLQREKMAGEMALKREQIAAEMQLKREQLSAELMLKRELAMEEMQIKREVGFYTADTKAATSTKTSGVHVGGDPG